MHVTLNEQWKSACSITAGRFLAAYQLMETYKLNPIHIFNNPSYCEMCVTAGVVDSKPSCHACPITLYGKRMEYACLSSKPIQTLMSKFMKALTEDDLVTAKTVALRLYNNLKLVSTQSTVHDVEQYLM